MKKTVNTINLLRERRKFVASLSDLMISGPWGRLLIAAARAVDPGFRRKDAGLPIWR